LRVSWTARGPKEGSLEISSKRDAPASFKGEKRRGEKGEVDRWLFTAAIRIAQYQKRVSRVVGAEYYFCFRFFRVVNSLTRNLRN